MLYVVSHPKAGSSPAGFRLSDTLIEAFCDSMAELAEGGGGKAGLLLKLAVKMYLAGVAALLCDFLYGQIGVLQQLLGILNAHGDQIRTKRDAEGGGI